MDTDTYKTSDLWIAGYLRANKIEPVKNWRNDRGIVTFEFPNKEVCDELVNRYQLTEVTISLPDLRMYIDRMRDIAIGQRIH